MNRSLCTKQKKISAIQSKHFFKVPIFLKHRNSPYIWTQTYIFTRGNSYQCSSHITVYHMNNVSKFIADHDTEFKIRSNEIALFGNGKFLIAKEYESLKFVIFHFKENEGCLSSFENDFFDRVDDEF